MTAVSEARSLYVDYTSGHHASMVGAYVAFSEEENRQFRFRERQDAVADTFETLGTPDTLGVDEERGCLTFRVPSPWHCVIHFIAHCRGWLTGKIIGRSSALLYRGQGDSAWPLVASLHRNGVDVERERSAIYAFVNILERSFKHMTFTSMFAPSLMLLTDDLLAGEHDRKVVHVATAQHYGLRTQLLDFTTDPAVAVWFACQSALRSGAKEASVFALPTRFALPTGGAVILPHPFVTRLYRQRGAFVENRISPLGLRHICVEVRFPPSPEFALVRDGKQVELLENDPFWSNCAAA